MENAIQTAGKKVNNSASSLDEHMLKGAGAHHHFTRTKLELRGGCVETLQQVQGDLNIWFYLYRHAELVSASPATSKESLKQVEDDTKYMA